MTREDAIKFVSNRDVNDTVYVYYIDRITGKETKAHLWCSQFRNYILGTMPEGENFDYAFYGASAYYPPREVRIWYDECGQGA